MDTTAKDVAAKLKGLIDQHGPSYMTDKPYEANLELTESYAMDGGMAGAMLHIFVSGLLAEVRSHGNPASLSKAIQQKCFFKEDAADRMAEILSLLYSPANEKDWADKGMKGFEEFLDRGFDCKWDGFAIWDEGNGTVDCRYHAEIALSPKEPFAEDGKLEQMLDENPFMGAEAIAEHYAKSLRAHLDGAFGEYCECDEYYQPVVEDFEVVEWTSEWCRANGFEIVKCEGSGYDCGYEPKISSGYW